MGQPVIRVENVSKSYRVSEVGTAKYRTVQESMWDMVKRPLRSLSHRRSDGADRETFWALRQVDFEIEQGDVTGLIGVNGAGKSTLLKILSHITQPTTGRAAIRGRVASLLEVGTGFHAELTGRENILLNGAILGMKRHETLRKFDQIVDFAGVERFVDTPVKRYSSGMYLRLAFAVAAHLDPEVLLVDEVLAVGDIAFQRKCLGRMREVSQEGRTVLLVSHNLVSIEALCKQCLLLDAGRLVQHGEVTEITREYRKRIQGDPTSGAVVLGAERTKAGQRRVITSLTLLDETGDVTRCFPLGGEFRAVIGLDLPPEADIAEIVLRIEDQNSQRLMTFKNPLVGDLLQLSEGHQKVECRVPQMPLTHGEYHIGLAVFLNKDCIDSVDQVVTFTITNNDVFGNARGGLRGICFARSEWRHVDDEWGVSDPAAEKE
ncbi:MAG TPA: polysaccharide ABC transporter ATP-binding protein [Chthonomonadaceae bacterium]|nr:polysaccharide ABC transporter ATP-binding protein [Chthonomonadaceae bacterium]